MRAILLLAGVGCLAQVHRNPYHVLLKADPHVAPSVLLKG